MKKKIVQIRNLTRPQASPLRAEWCDSFVLRLRGFTFRASLGLDESLVLVESRESRMDTAIHMFFVFTDLAIAWVNAENIVVDTALAKAWRPFYAPQKPAQYVVEYHPSRYGDLRVGDQVSFDHE